MEDRRASLGVTGSSTELLLPWEGIREGALTLKPRETYKNFTHTHRKFKPDLTMDKEQLLEMVRDLQRQHQKIAVERPMKETRQTSREEEVNETRQRVLEALRVNPHHKTKKAIAKDAGCHPQTVTNVLAWLSFSSLPLPIYHYNNIHSPQTLERLDQTITNPANHMLTVADHKRRVPQCSKKFIAKRLKDVHGLRYLRLKRERKNPDKNPYDIRKANRTLFKSVTLTSMQAFARGGETILYMDECEFPLYHTPEYCWTNRADMPVYNRRAEETSLHVIGLCSQERYVAIQVLENHPNKYDIHYFLTNFLTNWKSSDRLIILLDNAGWHVANTIMKGEFKELLLYSVPYMFQLNLIELTFSKAKAEWRKRPVVESLEEEVQAVVRIFTESIPQKGFGGYRRQYLRQVKFITQELLS